jgi:hydroxymethylbilane synthase
VIVIGSRGSALALWQARHIAAHLESMGVQTRIEVITTSGDKIQNWPLAKVGGKGLFTKEIEEALLDGTIDLAVHSMKDVPTAVPKGLIIAAIPQREEARDALIGCTVAELRAGMRIGTSSLRRSSQLLAREPGVQIEMLRGNVDTRLRKFDDGKYDAIVLAAAGLRRLGLQDRIRELFPVDVMCPAVGQGALAIETRDDNGPAQQAARSLDHPETRTAVTAERALLETLGGNCQVPVGAFAGVQSGTIHLTSVVIAPDGGRVVRDDLSGDDPVRLGDQLGQRLLNAGGREILAEILASPEAPGAA